ncbi:hypothetical protein EVAR_22160_1 [Eumeta japonica]|uniref:Uncharacterized protein n=1 Tax=Eumeta variegata TaxID=151549 RepID=A0A4C1VYB9_EUMVA|nr:hypothetical protein EVAR_22160_1 [Eumeta japonica]
MGLSHHLRNGNKVSNGLVRFSYVQLPIGAQWPLIAAPSAVICIPVTFTAPPGGARVAVTCSVIIRWSCAA